MLIRFSVGVVRKIITATVRHVLGTITQVETQDPVAALTFDDGPHPDYTPQLLDILGRHQARATFFMVGEAARQYPRIVRQVAEAGHAIGNHTWDHPSLPLLPGRERRAQMRACANAIAPYGQRLFRPPYGHQSLKSRLDALWLRHQVITWSVFAYDWLDREADWMAEHLVNQVQPGSIIILHDAITRSLQTVPQYNRQQMLSAVDMFLERIGERLRFNTIPELLQHGRPRRENWYMRADSETMERLQNHPAITRACAASKNDV